MEFRALVFFAFPVHALWTFRLPTLADFPAVTVCFEKQRDFAARRHNFKCQLMPTVMPNLCRRFPHTAPKSGIDPTPDSPYIHFRSQQKSLNIHLVSR